MDTLLAFFLGLGIGIPYYFFDFRKMIKPYREWYGLTHKDPLAEEIQIGFVYGQPFSGKLYSAVFLAILITAVIILTGSTNMLIQLLYGLFVIVGLMLAFYIAPIIFRRAPGHLSKIKKALDKMDSIEENLSIREGTIARGALEIDVVEPEKTASKTEEKSEEKKGDDAKKEDWRGGVKDFLND